MMWRRCIRQGLEWMHAGLICVGVIYWLQTVPGRPLIPNLAGLTLQQRQAILAQQRFMLTSDARRMLVRPPSSGIILPPGRVLLTSNGPASLMPGVAGRPAGIAAVTTSSGVLLTMAPTAVTHRPEKRKYDALRSDGLDSVYYNWITMFVVKIQKKMYMQ